MGGEPDGSPYFAMTAMGDVSTGAHACGAVCAALLYRERTGIGQHLDLSLLDTYFHYHEAAVEAYSLTKGEFNPTRSGQAFVVCAAVRRVQGQESLLHHHRDARPSFPRAVRGDGQARDVRGPALSAQRQSPQECRRAGGRDRRMVRVDAERRGLDGGAQGVSRAARAGAVGGRGGQSSASAPARHRSHRARSHSRRFRCARILVPLFEFPQAARTCRRRCLASTTRRSSRSISAISASRVRELEEKGILRSGPA